MDGRATLVAGQTEGLGSASVKDLASASYKLISASLPHPVGASELEIADHADHRAPQWTEHGSTDFASVMSCLEAVLTRFDAIDVVPNASALALGEVDALSEEAWQVAIQTDLPSLAWISKSASPALRRSPNGHDIPVSSAAGLIGPARRAVYGSIKIAQASLVGSAAANLRNAG